MTDNEHRILEQSYSILQNTTRDEILSLVQKYITMSKKDLLETASHKEIIKLAAYCALNSL